MAVVYTDISRFGLPCREDYRLQLLLKAEYIRK